MRLVEPIWRPMQSPLSWAERPVNTTEKQDSLSSSVQREQELLHSTSSIEYCGRTSEEGEQGTVPYTSAGFSPADGRGPYDCPAAMVVDAWDTAHGGHHVIQTRCNRWSCPGCGPLRTRILCRRLATGQPNRFVTLTAGRPDGRTPHEVWEDTRRQVPELIRRIRKEVGPTEYARVLEVHRSGYPHYHLLVRSPYLNQHTLSRWWCDLTDAFIVDVRAVDPQRRVAEYIGKYLSKQMAVPFTTRRCTWSRGYFPPQEKVEGEGISLIQPQRESGPLALYLARQYPDVEWEMLSRTHAVRVFGDSGELGWEIIDDGSF